MTYNEFGEMCMQAKNIDEIINIHRLYYACNHQIKDSIETSVYQLIDGELKRTIVKGISCNECKDNKLTESFNE